MVRVSKAGIFRARHIWATPPISAGAPLHRTLTPVTIVAPGGNVVHVVSAYPKDGSHDE
jgi:hypothetical protein